MTRIPSNQNPSTLHRVLLDRADEHGGTVALTVLGEDISYTRLVEEATSMANSLRKHGIRKGDVVATLLENCADQIYLEFAVSMLGAVEVMINTAYRGEYLIHQLRNCRAQVLICDRDNFETVDRVLPDLPDLRMVFVTPDAAGVAAGPARVGLLGLEALYDGDRTNMPLANEPDWRDPCAISYTSGTTGPSKAVLLSHHYLLTLSYQTGTLWNKDADDVFYACTPLFHTSAKCVGVMAAIVHSSRCVVDQRFSVSKFWQRVTEERCTSTILLGSMATMLMTLPPSPEEKLRTAVALPIPPESTQMAKRWQCTFETTYGLSEAAPIALSSSRDEPKAGSSGRVNTERYDVRILDEFDRPLPHDEPGEIAAT